MECNHLLFLQNAFSNALFKHGLDYFNLFVVDLMHEVEIGFWKSLLIHLLQILEAADQASLHELDQW